LYYREKFADIKLPTINLPITPVRNIVLKVLLKQNLNFAVAYEFIYNKIKTKKDDDITKVKGEIDAAKYTTAVETCEKVYQY